MERDAVKGQLMWRENSHQSHYLTTLAFNQNLFGGVRFQSSFELLKKWVDKLVPSVEDGVTHGRHRIAHHSHVFLFTRKKKNDYTVDVVIGNLFALHRDSLVFLQNGCGRDRECNILPCVQSYAYRRKATCLLTTRSLRWVLLRCLSPFLRLTGRFCRPPDTTRTFCYLSSWKRHNHTIKQQETSSGVKRLVIHFLPILCVWRGGCVFAIVPGLESEIRCQVLTLRREYLYPRENMQILSRQFRVSW